MTTSTTVVSRIGGIPTAAAIRLRNLEPDANGQIPLKMISDGKSNPCRHCLGLIAKGDPMLLLAYRPFDAVQPYAETGPVFLHQDACERYDSNVMPAWFDHFDPAIIRGYSETHYIRYDTGKAIAGKYLATECQKILGDESVAYVHIRSKFNCFQCRVDRA
ncbi:MAG: DUF1203 domain-containing protein [Arenimonas sp.]